MLEVAKSHVADADFEVTESRIESEDIETMLRC